MTERATDLRLLLAAVIAWAALAITLSWTLAHRGLLVAGLVLAVLAVVGAATHRRRLRRRGRLGRHAVTEGRWSGLLLLSFASVLLLQFAATGNDLRAARGDVQQLVAERAAVTVTGRVETEPRRLVGRFGEEQVIVVVAVSTITGRGETGPAAARLQLVGDQELLQVRWSSTVTVAGRLSPPRDAGPEIGRLRITGPIREVDPAPAVARAAQVLRTALTASVRDLPEDARGLLPGLVIGDTSALPPDLDEAMRATGMTHLTAVSGSNVAVVIGLVFGGCTLVGVPRRLRPWLAMLALAGFVVLARPEPSVLRASAMGAIGLIGISRHRRSIGPPLLGGAILTVLTVDPWLARSYGFVLSTLATLGLLLLAGPWGDHLAPHFAKVHPRLRLLGPAVAVPLAAQVVCGPVIVLLQGSVPIVGVLANLLAAPLIPMATIGGVACAGVAVLSPTLGGWLAWLPALPTLGVARVARALAVVPGGSVPWPDGAPGAGLLAVITVLTLLVGRSLLLVALAHPIVTLLVVALFITLLVPTRTFTWPPTRWRMVACDVGQGDGIVLRSGPASAVVVDVGPDPALIDGCLDRLGVDVVDAVVLTHFHADHVGGIDGVSRGRQVKALLVTAVDDDEPTARDVRTWAQRQGLKATPLRIGDRFTAGALTASVWWPARRIDAGSVPNNSSVVLAVRTGEVDALLLGDIEREAGAAILSELRRRPEFASAARSFDVVKTPHHGSANISPALMEAIRAPVGIVSVGADNDYGHPSATQLSLLRRLGYAVYRTDLRGDIAVVDTDSGEAVVTMR